MSKDDQLNIGLIKMELNVIKWWIEINPKDIVHPMMKQAMTYNKIWLRPKLHEDHKEKGTHLFVYTSMGGNKKTEKKMSIENFFPSGFLR